MVGVLEPRAGMLYPEKCIAAYLRLAEVLGAELCTNEEILSWKATAENVTIRTAKNEYFARTAIVAAGAWAGEMVPELGQLLTIERQVLLWFRASDPSLFSPERFPIHLWEYEPEKMFYGFPDLGAGVKVAFHHQGEFTTPGTVDRNLTTDDIENLRLLLKRYLPAADGDFLRGTVCLYTNTPDGHFILDRHPESDRVIVASPCSGHGFKFASAIGEVLADLVLDGKSSLDLSLFRLDRFQ
jgi:sarcosine oxidase